MDGNIFKINLSEKNQLLVVLFKFSTGLHTDHVFPAVLEGQAARIFWDPSQSYPRQPGSWPALGSWHVFPKWQEVFCPRCHSEEPHDPPAPGWHSSLWIKVRTDSLSRAINQYCLFCIFIFTRFVFHFSFHFYLFLMINQLLITNRYTVICQMKTQTS